MLIIQKYGGTSVASVERIKAVASRIKKTKDEGHKVAVVVSAMAGETDRLIALAGSISKEPAPREKDVLVATGEQAGTQVLKQVLETTLVSAVTCTANEAKLSVRRVPDKEGLPARIFEPLAKANINVDMIVQATAGDGLLDISFTVLKPDLKKAIELTETAAKKIGAGKVEAAGDVSKVSIIGVGMRSHAGIAASMFDVLAREGIKIQLISTSEIKVSVVVDMKYTERAVRALHEEFIF